MRFVVPSCLLVLALAAARAGDAPDAGGTGSAAPRANPESGLGPVEADVFHPDHQPRADGTRPALPKPAYGGRAIVHLEQLPKTLNGALENLGVVRRMMCELHETLVRRDWETLELEPDLAREWWIEDGLHLQSGVASEGSWTLRRSDEDIVRGTVTDTGESYVVETRIASNKTVRSEYKKTVVKRVELGTVLTFILRDDVTWHDGHAFDARDVKFSLDLYKNPAVDCGPSRATYEGILKTELLDGGHVRVWLDRQSYSAFTSVGVELTILPAHLYDLEDPDNQERAKRKDADAAWKADPAAQAEFVNKNPHNRDWVGLGPYQLAKFDEEGVRAVRFDRYFDRERAGYLDEIFWRYIRDDAVALQALLNGELDFFGRMTADDYFGAVTESEAFKKSFYKGYVYTGNYWFTAWNLRRPKLADVRVRRAIAHAFDAEGFKNSFYKGLARIVTGPWIMGKPEYNEDVKPLAHDTVRARELLADAGWIDRDGDGVVDKDGVPLEIELLSETGNGVSKAFAASLQEDLAKVGIRLRYTAVDTSAMVERKTKRDFDGIALGWALTWETDPEQIWHSKCAPADSNSKNFTGFADPASDQLITRGQRELDPRKRAALWRELHARIYELQPYLFGYSPPRKFALNKRIRGVQLVLMDPNYVLRRWYYPEGTPGTRPALDKQ